MSLTRFSARERLITSSGGWDGGKVSMVLTMIRPRQRVRQCCWPSSLARPLAEMDWSHKRRVSQPHATKHIKKRERNISQLCLIAATGSVQLSLDRSGPAEWGEVTRSFVKAQRRHTLRTTFQGQVYNFLERPSGWKCIIYHTIVWVYNLSAYFLASL